MEEGILLLNSMVLTYNISKCMILDDTCFTLSPGIEIVISIHKCHINLTVCVTPSNLYKKSRQILFLCQS